MLTYAGATTKQTLRASTILAEPVVFAAGPDHHTAAVEDWVGGQVVVGKVNRLVLCAVWELDASGGVQPVPTGVAVANCVRQCGNREQRLQKLALPGARLANRPSQHIPLLQVLVVVADRWQVDVFDGPLDVKGVPKDAVDHDDVLHDPGANHAVLLVPPDVLRLLGDDI